MTEDWSLKKFKARHPVDQWSVEWKDIEYYKIEDIETLRKKIIEDISIWDWMDDGMNGTPYKNMKWIIKCINKRFGVDE